MNYRFVEYRPEYRDQVVEFQKQLWSHDRATNDAYLCWKYERNPYIADPMISLALQDQQIVGMRGAWGARWHLHPNEASTVVPCTGDTLIAPEHRGTGLLLGLIQALLGLVKKRGYPYVLSLSASKPVYVTAVIDGWQPIASYDELRHAPPMFKVRQLRKLRARFRSAVPKRLQRLASNALTRSSQATLPDDISLSSKPRIGDMTEIIERVRPHQSIGHIRDKSYYSWRFDCPLSKYQFLYSGRDSLNGFLVLQSKSENRRGPNRAINIIDWEAIDASTFESLIRAAIKLAALVDVAIWSNSLSPPIKAALDRCGFEASSSQQNGAYQRGLLMRETGLANTKDISEGISELCAGANDWNLRMIYSDDY